MKQLWTGSSHNNVISVEEAVNNPISMVILNNEVSDLASTNPSVSKKVANREYHARGACFKP
jgi:hypothetical protein